MSESSSSEYQEDALTLTPSSGVTAPQKTPRSSDEWNSPSSMALSLHSSPLDESYERANNFLSNSPQALENFRGLLNSLFAKRSPSAICIINGLVGSCVFNPVLRLGLASLYELDQLRCSSRIEGDSPKFENARTQALKIYNSAIKKFAIHLKHGLVGFEDLMSCFIFICFEIIQGNYLAAFRHHQGCQGVIQRIKSLGCSTHSENTALVAFERISLHLENQATSYIGTKASNTGFGCSQSRISYPCFFTSLAEARHALDQQITDFLQFLIPHDYLGSDYCPPWTKYEGRSAGHFTVFHGSFKGYIPPDFATRRDQLLDALRAWKCCFGSSLQRQNDWSSDASPESISLIWISYWMTYIRVSTAHAVDENFYDAFLPTFELIITEAQHVLRDADPSSSESTDKKMRLGETIFGSGLVECLYFTCLKCREPGLRQKALTLLPRAGNDGIWEGELLAMVAEYVIQLETATPGDSNTIWSQDKFIDASRRVNGIALDIDKAHSRLWVRTVRNGSPCGDTRLSWEVEDAVLVLYHEKKS